MKNSKHNLNGWMVLPNEKAFLCKKRQITKVKVLKKDYQKSKTFIGGHNIKWL